MESNGGEIRQGFLCPFCFRDLCTGEALVKHVEEVHPDNPAYNDTIDALKGAFGRAKQKILKIDFSISNQSSSTNLENKNAGNYESYYDDVHEDGITRSWKSEFVAIRDRRVSSVDVDTNNLILRLDKLINDCPDEASRRAFEQETVPWTADTTHCQACNAKFGLARRKHHCRLCGSVVCKDCSKFLSFDFARQITNPAFAAPPSYDTDNGEESNLKSLFVDNPVRKTRGKLLSTFGLDAKFNLPQFQKPHKEEDPTIRVCTKCTNLLVRRQEAMAQMSMPSIFVDMYEKLGQLIIQVGNLAPSYRRMGISLKNGESMYTLDAAIQLKKKLTSLQSEIQTLSDRIEKWGLENDDPLATKPTPRERVLRANIRFSAVAAIQESILDMPELPTKDEYMKLQEKHKEQVRRQLEDEYAAGFKTCPSNPVLKQDRSGSPSYGNEKRRILKTSASFSGTQNDGGWTPEPSDEAFRYNPFTDTDPGEEINPVQQQYIIIKNYLKQAAQSGRLQEIEMLEKNMKDIEIELKRLNLSTPRVD
uniref:FYVE-type domain-containing protein n=1 Tax=Panagrellus redivivus TaxID=6233 RepID=A0A7E5A1E5_PANRE